MHVPVETPHHHPDCCLSLSLKLFRWLKSVLGTHCVSERRNTLLLSISCGSGLFEASFASFLHDEGLQHIRVEGVEVQSAKTPYLSNELLHHVKGAWAMPGSQRADALLFVYPRDGHLVQQYLSRFEDSVFVVIWLGPRADWTDQQPLLQEVATFSAPMLIEHAGLVPYEIAVVFENRALGERI